MLKFDLLAATVGDFGAQRVVHVGAGSGVFARLLLERTRCQESICVDPHTDTGSGSRFNKGQPSAKIGAARIRLG